MRHLHSDLVLSARDDLNRKPRGSNGPSNEASTEPKPQWLDLKSFEFTSQPSRLQTHGVQHVAMAQISHVAQRHSTHGGHHCASATVWEPMHLSFISLRWQSC